MDQDFPHVVVWDPENEYWAGSVVDTRMCGVLAARGVALLPCDTDIFRRSAVSGFFMRQWGAGYPIDSAHPRMHCPMLLHVLPSHQFIHWAALLLPTTPDVAAAVANRTLQGTLRLASDPSQAMGNAPGLVPGSVTPAEARDLGRPNKVGGWVARGTASIQTLGEGLGSFALYGAVPGMRVAWAAITQSARG